MITTEQEYEAALIAVEKYFDVEPEPGSADGERFEALVTAIEAYESKF